MQSSIQHNIVKLLHLDIAINVGSVYSEEIETAKTYKKHNKVLENRKSFINKAWPESDFKIGKKGNGVDRTLRHVKQEDDNDMKKGATKPRRRRLRKYQHNYLASKCIIS